ncbi:MAG: hypothetical protein WEB67_05400 [Acidimicrobiia bacterium]
MTNNDNVQAAATGCLSRVFTLVGLFWAGAIAFGVIRNLNSGFDTDLTGAIFPALAFLFAGSVMRRRAREARTRADTFSAPTTPTGTRRAMTKPTTIALGKTPTPYVPSPTESAKKKRQPERPVPELPPLEPAPDPGKLLAIDNLEMSDFETGKALSSEERIRLAREKYSKKKPRPNLPR